MSEQQQPQQHSLVERILAFTAIAIIVVAVISFLTTLVIALVAGRDAPSEGLLQVVTFISIYGLPIGFLLLIVLLIINFVRLGSKR